MKALGQKSIGDHRLLAAAAEGDNRGLYALAVAAGFRPDPTYTLSEWAEREYYLSQESSAEAGPWRAWPFQREILDAFSDSDVEIVVWMKSARVGYTKVLGAAIAYHIAEVPCPQLVVQPRVEDAQGWSKDELAPMLRDVRKLNGLVADPKSRDSGNTITKKSYPGGTLSIVGANSPAGFRRLTVRNVFFDEVDGYPESAGGEGDQIRLGMRRSQTYWNRKIGIGSTPGTKGVSRVEAWYELSDQRRYFVPCPECGAMDVLRWADIKWPDGEPEKAEWCCPSCGSLVPHSRKRWMVERGEWRPTNPDGKPGVRGFHIWAGYSYSPNTAWGELAVEFVEANAQRKIGNIEPLKTFVNTVLGETWEEQGESVDYEYLYVRREDLEDDAVPRRCLVVTLGVDVQADRLEAQTIGWGPGEESWVLDYRILKGDPGHPEVWADLDRYLLTASWESERGRIGIVSAAVDSGGHHAQEVYDFCGARTARRVYAVRGQSTAGKPIVGKPSKPLKGKRHSVTLIPVGTEAAKDAIFARLTVEVDGPGRVHFSSLLDAPYFKSLTSEHAITTYTRGRAVRRWVLRPGFRRNEALDTMVYALAALRMLNPDWAALAGKEAVEPAPKSAALPNTAVLRRPRRSGPARRGGGWVNSWK